MRSRDKEIRRFLCGYAEQQQGYLVTVDGFKKNILREPLQGSFSVRYRGAYYLIREYRINGKADPIYQWIEQRIFSLGMPAILRKRIDDACALRVPRFSNPVFYDMERQEKRLLLRIYTSPGFLARWTCKKALKLFEADMPERLIPCDVELSNKEQKEAAKQLRQEEKALRHKRRDEPEKAEEIPEQKSKTKKKEKSNKYNQVPEYIEETEEPEEAVFFAEPETGEPAETAVQMETCEEPEKTESPAEAKPHRKPASAAKKPEGNSRPASNANRSSRPPKNRKTGNKK